MFTDESAELRKKLPERISRLADLVYDLWWSSSEEARSLFRSISRHHWWTSDHNPIRLLQDIDSERLALLAADNAFLAKYDALMEFYGSDLLRKDRFVATHHPEIAHKTIAYFSAEYGIHASLPIYSGGLGILAGDHVKTAHDMGLPIVAVGFLYPYGYFEQHIDSEGDQIAEYRHLVTAMSPLKKVISKDGEPLIISLQLGEEESKLHLQIWHITVGNVTIYLMDSDLDLNATSDREITKRLYGGDTLYRLRQEIALGVGGVRALSALGITADVWHANEGHASFMLVERLRQEVLAGKSIVDALAHIRATSVFTTHTPVPAGHDAFSPEIIADYFHDTIREIGISKEEFLELGKHPPESGTVFNMTALALRMSEHRNAVSMKHRDVTRAMWSEYENDSHQIIGVTNGIHIPTWISHELDQLFTQEIASDWKDRLLDGEMWKKVFAIPDEKLWEFRKDQSRSLQRHIIDNLRLTQIDESESELVTRGAFCNPYALTIGFARRFATYKRATLLFKDPDRLARILNRKDRPVQIIFSGKAHPADKEGKALIKEIWEYACDPLFRGKIVFLENYTMHSAKLLVQGVDLWMNTPRPPMEASGTSGMKAAINGVPNLSVMDGWWCEGYNGTNGWAIHSPVDEPVEIQDMLDAKEIYRLLEEEIIPLYFTRDLQDIPKGWLDVIKESMYSVIPNFTSERMMKQYIEELYIPA
ncbi:MAG: alpha-glucan family phosphorylase, partial [Bacteroidota bacterium]|nr:alpha-glucan family phosphorylase [Bacteroidota bacterium]